MKDIQLLVEEAARALDQEILHACEKKVRDSFCEKQFCEKFPCDVIQHDVYQMRILVWSRYARLN